MGKDRTLEIIRNEIERRQKENFEQEGQFAAGRVVEDADILSFLDTLEKSEKPMNQEGLEDEAVSYCFDNGLNISPRVATNFARYFYDLGCTRTAEKYDEIEYNKQRAEESEKPTDELEEEISKSIENLEGCSTKIDGNPEYHLISDEDLREFARHFAQWGAVHAKDESEKSVPNDAKEVAKEYARYHYADTFSQELAENDFIAGSAWKEMLMLKEAVEGFIFQSEDYYPKELVARYDGELKHGDKVRVIIVKED